MLDFALLVFDLRTLSTKVSWFINDLLHWHFKKSVSAIYNKM
jgi:hypothetical protein